MEIQLPVLWKNQVIDQKAIEQQRLMGHLEPGNFPLKEEEIHGQWVGSIHLINQFYSYQGNTIIRVGQDSHYVLIPFEEFKQMWQEMTGRSVKVIEAKPKEKDVQVDSFLSKILKKQDGEEDEV